MVTMLAQPLRSVKPPDAATVITASIPSDVARRARQPAEKPTIGPKRCSEKPSHLCEPGDAQQGGRGVGLAEEDLPVRPPCREHVICRYRLVSDWQADTRTGRKSSDDARGGRLLMGRAAEEGGPMTPDELDTAPAGFTAPTRLPAIA